MVVFITSSPYIDGADRAILNPQNEFVDRLRSALPPNPQALFVCSHPDDHNMTCHFGADTVSAFAMAGMAFSGYQVLDGYNAEDAERLVHSSDIVVFAGGHVPTQNAFFQAIHLREILEGYDGVVMGISAGSMNLAEEVYVQPEEEGESAPDFQRFAPGLALTDINILPHYQKVKNYILDGLRLYEDITFADSMGHTFFALPDGSYIYQDESGQLLCGRAYRVRDGIMELLTLDGECMDMEGLK
jgi:dipeptidase E